MSARANTVLLSRVIVPLLGIVIWSLFYFDGRFAYRMPRGAKRLRYQGSVVVAAALVFLLQILTMERLAPSDAYGDYFFGFVMIEAGGGLVVLFATLFRERARSKKQVPKIADSRDP